MKYKLEIINVNDISKKEYDEILNKLNKVDKGKYQKMPSDRAKHFLAGRYLLDKNLIDISKIYYLDRKPVIDSSYFSISHSDDLTTIVISDEPIGVDIERIREVDERVSSILKTNQKDVIKEFTKREAYIKLNGLGMKNLNDDVSSYKFITKKYNNYYITVAFKKNK